MVRFIFIILLLVCLRDWERGVNFFIRIRLDLSGFRSLGLWRFVVVFL